MSSQISIKIDPKKINSLFTILKKKGIIFSTVKSNYETFRGRYDDSVIIGYNSGSIVFTKNEKIQNIIEEALLEILPIEWQIVIGSDEVGKGEWLGPLVVAAVALSPLDLIALQSSGVIDSKKLSENKINELALKIEKKAEALSTIIMMPKRFNELWSTMKSEGKNLNDLLAWMHSKAIENVMSEIEKKYMNIPIKIIIDEFSRDKTEKRLQNTKKKNNIVIIQKPHAEDNVAVAAASIIAKFNRENKIDDLSRLYNINIRNVDLNTVKKLNFYDEIAKVDYIKNIKNSY